RRPRLQRAGTRDRVRRGRSNRARRCAGAGGPPLRRCRIPGMIDSPDAPLGYVAAGDRVALVRSSIAPLHAEPRVSSPQVSQRLAWHPVGILAASGDWRQVRGLDGYEGWVHAGYLAPVAALGREVDGWPAEARVSLGCEVMGVTG